MEKRIVVPETPGGVNSSSTGEGAFFSMHFMNECKIQYELYDIEGKGSVENILLLNNLPIPLQIKGKR